MNGASRPKVIANSTSASSDKHSAHFQIAQTFASASLLESTTDIWWKMDNIRIINCFHFEKCKLSCWTHTNAHRETHWMWVETALETFKREKRRWRNTGKHHSGEWEKRSSCRNPINDNALMVSFRVFSMTSFHSIAWRLKSCFLLCTKWVQCGFSVARLF